MRKPLFVAFAALALVTTILVGSPGSPGVRDARADDVAVAVDLSVFYDGLSPHGEWVRHDPYGWVWLPVEVDYAWRPYAVGSWVWVDGWGWTWISEEPWSWAVYHYGRWLWTPEYGWVWIPGTVWAGAWVEFRFGGGWIGWAPMPPVGAWRYDAGPFETEVAVALHSWTFVPVRSFVEPTLPTRIVSTVHNPELLAVTRPAGSYAIADGRVTSRAIDPAEIEKIAGTKVRRVKAVDAPRPDAKGALRVEGDTLHVFRPSVQPKAAKEPTRRDLNANDVLRRREDAMKRYLDGQSKRLDEDLHGIPPTDLPPPDTKPNPRAPNPPPVQQPQGPPPGTPNADEIRRRREERQKYLEEEKKRMQDLLEQERKRRGGDRGRSEDAPGQDKDKSKNRDEDDPGKKKKDKDQ